MGRKEQLISLIEKEPQDIFLHYALAMEYMSESDIENAIAKLEWIRNINPSYLPVYYQLGNLLAESDQEKAAIDIYNQGIELALKQGENKTAGELRSALDELLF
jgi:tetratricopeptide (TPR) repeat protein